MDIISNQAESFLQALSEELGKFTKLYEQAEASYKSFAKWFN